ncbi:MAG: mucoidy inhibitor MuiA family protein [Bacteroidales bacterium]|nr:mucoidy inhibitor MuiA family protein [Bacteroidales bacterium]
MKKSFALMLLCIAIAMPSFAQKQISAKLEQATVYLRGAALTHTATANLKSGSQEIIIDNLSPDIELNSLKVSANGVLVSASEFSNDFITPREESARIKKLTDSLEYYTDKLNDADNELSRHKQMLKLLTDGTQSNMQLKEHQVSIADINANMELYQTKAAELQKSIDKDKKKVEKLRETVNRLTQQIAEDNANSQTRTGILRLSISVPESITTKFTITYFTDKAQWVPCYDLNIPSMDKPIALKAKARVYQLTGLDWDNVRLTLSNATPNRYSQAPVFTPWHLNFQRNYRQYTNGVPLAKNSIEYDAASVQNVHSSLEGVSVQNAPILMDQFVEVEEQDIQVSYNIAVPYDIPGNGKPQLIDLKSYDIKADFKYYSIPKLSDETYLVATLSDYEQYNLLPGEATVTFDNTFVGKSFIRPNNTEEHITLTLTTEPRMTVKREKRRDYCETKHVGNSTTVTQSFEITVKNNLNRSAKLTLKEQYPISNNKDIEVKDVSVSPNATYDKTDIGVITWDTELKAGETKTFIITYSVKYPKDKVLNAF